MSTLKQKLIDGISAIDDSDLNDIDFMNKVMDVYAGIHPFKHNPTTKVKYIPIKKIKANTYNPNSVANKEMELLHTSIEHDGYTQPTVAFYDDYKDHKGVISITALFSCCYFNKAFLYAAFPGGLFI